MMPILISIAAADFADIRDIVSQPNPWPWIIAALLLLGAIAAFLLWRRRRPAKSAAALSYEPPHDRALRRLEALEKEADRMEDDPFTVAVSGILRDYLEEALDLRAPEQTTEEFLQELRDKHHLTEDLQQSLEAFLRLTDLVKFARQPLTGDQRQRLLTSARETIVATRPPPLPAPS